VSLWNAAVVTATGCVLSARPGWYFGVQSPSREPAELTAHDRLVFLQKRAQHGRRQVDTGTPPGVEAGFVHVEFPVSHHLPGRDFTVTALSTWGAPFP